MIRKEFFEIYFDNLNRTQISFNFAVRLKNGCRRAMNSDQHGSIACPLLFNARHPCFTWIAIFQSRFHLDSHVSVGFRNHLAVHGLCISLPADQKIIHPSNSSGGNSSDDLVESGKLSAHDITVPARSVLDYESTILATCDALTETEETKVDKQSIARLGRWTPITLSAPARQYHFLASPTTASVIMEDPDTGMWYMPLRVPPSHSFEAIDGDILVQAAL
ncbi:hypothetical protein [Parasitella parasitica]|uniref:Uncharacterized protein n=1 Tax=Parasitella parasitica TaxID=35722 RepID=A0A0B7MYQ0_9FUNG|nr:hypothetical protein [Parasitella parasitica]